MNERLCTVGVAQIDTRAGLQDLVVANDPSPGREFGGDTIRLLTSALSDEDIRFDSNVMSVVVQAAFGANSESTGYVAAVDPQVLDRDVATVDDLDCIASRSTGDQCRWAGRWARDGNPCAGLAVEVGDSKRRILSGSKHQDIARLQNMHHLTIVGRVASHRSRPSRNCQTE